MNGHADEKALPKGVPFDGYQPPNWDEFFMLKVYLTGEMIIIIDYDLVIFFCSEKIERSSNENRCSART